MPPTTRLLQAVRALSPNPTSPSTSTAKFARTFSLSTPYKKWEGSQPKDHIMHESDSHNVRYELGKEGKEERAKSADGNGDGKRGSVKASRGTSEKAEGSNRKAKEEFPEAPDTVGMQDERGQKY